MALKLTGEVPSVIHGLDGLGWLEEVRRNSSDPALTIRQDGGGSALKLVLPSGSQSLLDFYAVATQIGHLYAESGNHLVCKTVGGRDIRLDPAGVIDLRATIKNLGAANSGNVYIDDGLRVTGVAQFDNVVTVPYNNLRLQADNTRVQLSWGNPGFRIPIVVPLTNQSAASASAGEVFVLDTANDYSVVAGTTAGNQTHPFVIVAGGATGAAIEVAVAGLVDVDCDTGAVSRGDVLVTSSVTAKKAMANNAQTDPNRIIGVALTAKDGGSNGSVRALIKSY
ncbi:MAG: hypothetical protein HY677_05690 [Chloroflexi bacterium]|nr:hypothetical protein [Chloroflexota bacterium]